MTVLRHNRLPVCLMKHLSSVSSICLCRWACWIVQWTDHHKLWLAVVTSYANNRLNTEYMPHVAELYYFVLQLIVVVTGHIYSMDLIRVTDC